MTKKIPKHIEQLIDSGESQVLDFKFEISSATKIAKTLVAFANTEGGTLLIGVKDNGSIAGIRTDEEIFMIQSAANIFSKPKIVFLVKPWTINDKQILEVTIPKGKKPPYFAKDTEDNWKSYVRVKDQNFVADNIFVRYLKERQKRNVKIEFQRQMEFLLDYLNDLGRITFKDFYEGAQISPKYAEDILVDLMILDIISIHITEKETFFRLK